VKDQQVSCATASRIAYELGFTHSERSVVIAVAEIRRVYRVHQNPGDHAAHVAAGKGATPPL
jgi:hypothetical protein